LIQNRVTIQEAARITNISRQTLYRWIEKGLLSREKDKNLSYVSLAEVQALCNQSDKPDVTDNVTSDNQNTQDVNRVTVDRAHYDGLLVRLGQLEAEKRYLLEYKTGLEAKDRELEQARSTIAKARSELQQLLQIKRDAEQKGRVVLDQQATLETKERELAEIRAENERLRLPWYKRIFNKK
jgi:excisionase family DNA binding protein